MLPGTHSTGRRAAVVIAALFITLSLLSATVLIGQMFLGSVVGQVTDTSGGVVPNARVVLTNTQTLVTRETVSNGAGDYTFDAVPTGIYTVSVSQTGFRQVISSNISVGTQASVRFDAVLQIGETSQKVEVTATAPTLNTENAQLGAVVTRAEIADLPMEKSPMNFRYLDSANQDGGYLAGQRSSFGFYAVDGVSAMAPAWGAWSGPMLGMSMDSIQDITEVTSTPSAEYGDVGNVSITTRSGTNTLHGSAFWDTNNYALDAAGYFSHTKGSGPYRQYIGGSIGGPVIIPHLYNGKGKTFFFFTWEEFLQPGGYVSLVSVPDAAFRNGDFSSLLALKDSDGNPAPRVIYDPTTWNAATQTFSPFPNNIIPPGRINAVSAKYQNSKYIPLPNYNPGGTLDWQNNYIGRYPNSHPHYYPTVRIDHNLRNGRDMITGRWQFRHQNEDGNSQDLPGFDFTQNRNTTNAYISETHSFTPAVVNEARIGFSRDFSNLFSNYLGGAVAQDVGIQIPNLGSLNNVHGFPAVNFNNFQALSGFANSGWAMNTMEYLDNVTWSHGRHVTKVGFSDRRYFVDKVLGQNDYFGSIGFGPFGTSNTINGVGTVDPNSGFDYASFLLGLPSGSALPIQGPNVIVHYGTYAAYIQEEWRVTNRLTLDAGLRWEHTPGPVDQNDMRYAFNPANGDLVVPSTKTLRLVNPVWPSSFPIETVAQAGWSTGRSLVSTSQDFGPRLSLAYQLPYKMVVRAGAGMFFTPLLSSIMMDNYAGGPFNVNEQFTNLMSPPTSGSAASFLFALPNPYSEAGNPAAYVAPTAGGLTVASNKKYLRTPLTDQYNLTVEKQFGANTLARVSYVGHHTIETIYYPDLNTPHICSPAAGNCNLTAEYNYAGAAFPNYYSVGYGVNGGSEFGNLMEVEFQRRYGKNLTFNISYTHTLLTEDVAYRAWGEWAGDSDLYGYPSYSWDRKYDRGNDGGLATNRFVGSGIWSLPLGKGQRFAANLPKALDKIVGGWQTSYILTMRSGYYNDVECWSCTDYGYARENGTRLTVNRLGNPQISNPTATKWFNASAFAPNAVVGTFGNAPPAVIAGPGLANLDFGLIKRIPIHENVNLVFKATMMNAFNHANLAGPDTAIDDSTVGQIFSLDNTGGLGSDHNGGMRQIMLGARLEF